MTAMMYGGGTAASAARSTRVTWYCFSCFSSERYADRRIAFGPEADRNAFGLFRLLPAPRLAALPGAAFLALAPRTFFGGMAAAVRALSVLSFWVSPLTARCAHARRPAHSVGGALHSRPGRADGLVSAHRRGAVSPRVRGAGGGRLHAALGPAGAGHSSIELCVPHVLVPIFRGKSCMRPWPRAVRYLCLCLYGTPRTGTGTRACRVERGKYMHM